MIAHAPDMELTASVVGFAVLLLGVGLLLGMFLRLAVPALQRLFLPSSILGGLAFLLLGPEVLGHTARALGNGHDWLDEGLFPQDVLNVWSTLPGILINVVFAALVLGRKVPTFRQIWLVAGPQISFGQMLAWGQYFWGILLTVLVLTPLFNLPAMAGALIEIGFEGGHGTAAGMAATFAELDFAEGADLALGLATVGVLAGMVFGVVMVNWGTNKRHTTFLKTSAQMPQEELRGVYPLGDRPAAGTMSTSPSAIEPLALTLAFLGLAILVGYVLLQALLVVERCTWGRWTQTAIIAYVPLFPLAMIGGLVVQLALDRFDKLTLVDRRLVLRIQGLALDFLIISALATLSLQVIGAFFVPFMLLAMIGIAWNVLGFALLARRMIPTFWFERGIGDLGQSLGMTAIGLLLIRMTDPNNESPAMEGFAYKQLMFEPIVGGGLFTAASVPLLFQFGPYPILILSGILMLGWAAFGILYFGRK